MTRKVKLPSRVSLFALATVMVVGASPAAAQSFQGDGTFTHGTGSITTPDSITTNISVTSPQAVIDWTPFADGGTSGQDIVFQAGSTTANFSSASDFAVLNRIDVDDMTRAIRMDGTITSKVNGVTGGSVYFYSPSGFVLGATSLIDVGSLVLTSRPITVDGNGNFINNGTVVFGAASDPFGNAVNPAARIETHSLAQINALNEGSYVAMVAPRVQHHGSIDVNGAAALVGAEAATITFRPSGLFDIQVTAGTTNGNGVAVYGDINGPASSGPGDYHRVYLVAVPKNDALTMLVQQGADLGFDVAQSADVVGNAVVLSAGHDIVNGQSSSTASAAAGALANLNINAANATSAVDARATNFIDVFSNPGQSTSFASDLTARAPGHVWVNAGGLGASTSIGGNLIMDADRTATVPGGSATGGNAALYSLNGASLFVGGDASLTSNGYGANSETAGVNAGNGTGGLAQVDSTNGSTLTIAGGLSVTADGHGGSPGAAGVNGGSGTGGTIYLRTIGNGAILGVGGTTIASASGFGGDGDGGECFSCNGLGGIGDGGFVSVSKNLGTGSSMSFGNDVTLIADGEGGRSALAGSASASGIGGDVSLSSSGDRPVEGFGLYVAGNLNTSAIGRGGESNTAGITAGLGDGGTIFLVANTNASIGIGGDYRANANGHGGYNDFGIDGGDGIGGYVAVTAQNGETLIDIAGDLDLRADGEASVVGSDCIACAGAGGNGYGGSTTVYGSGFGTNNVINVGGSLDMSAEGWGGIGVTGNAGLGDGGNAEIQAAAGFTVNVGLNATMEAEGYGGYAYNGNNAGNGIGGFASISGDGGTVDVNGSLTLDANGTGGNTGIAAGGIGGDGTGGFAQIYVGSGLVDVAGNLFVDGVGQGGTSVGGTGGNGFGGQTSVGTDGGTINIGTILFMDGGAIGGAGNIGGAATGGTATVTGTSGSATFGTVTLNTNGQGGAAANGTGGSGVGGVSIFNTNGATLLVNNNLTLTATSTGGAGIDGGDAVAFVGTNPRSTATTSARVLAGNGTITVNGVTLLDVSATGGAGSASGGGGDAGGGYATVFTRNNDAGPSTITMGALTVRADASGGNGGGALAESGANGGTGGNASGGFIAITASAGNGHLDIGDTLLTATATGGLGGDGDFAIGAVGGAGGDAYIGGRRGGQVYFGTENGAAMTVLENSGTASFNSVTADVSMVGGDGGNAWSGTGGAGGDADGNTTNNNGGGIGIFARGGTVTIGAVDATANAQGGDSGYGAGEVRNSTGGNAISGGLSLITNSRPGDVNMRATLNAGSVNLHGAATGGAGAVAGTGYSGAWSAVVIENSDIVMDDFTLAYGGSSGGWPEAIVDQYELFNSTFAVTNAFTVIDPTIVSFYLDTSSLTAGSFQIDAGDFIHDPFYPAPTAMGTITAASISLVSDNDIVLDANLVSTGSLDLDAAGLVDLGDLNGGAINVNAGETITLGDLSAAGGISLSGVGTVDVGSVSSSADYAIIFSETGNINTLAVDSGLYTSLQAGGSISTGAINSADFVDVLAGGNIALGNVDAGSWISVESLTGALALNNLSAPTTIDLDAAGNIDFTDVIADDFDFSAGGNVNGGNILAGTGAYGEAEGAIDLGNISVGIELEGGASEDGFAVGIVSATSINVLDVEADENIGFATFGPLTTGDLNTGGNIMTLASGDISVGAMTTGEFGEIYMADSSMFTAAGGLDDFIPSEVFNNDPVPTGGSITLGGPVSTGFMRVAAGNSLNINGSIATDGAYLISGDIALANGVTVSGFTSLASINSQGTFIGDGLSGTGGYRLSNTEYNQFLQDVSFEVRPDLGAAPTLTFGDLDIGSGIGDADFGIEDEEDTNLGTIRVVGDLVMHNGETGDLSFESETFQVDAATGSIVISSDGTTPGGELTIDANNIHVAEGAILDQLAENPQYEGYQDDLNAPAEVQRPDGVIRASIVNLEFGDTPAELYTLYVQNTGTSETPAGFVITDLGLDGDGEGGLPPGSLDLIINGQIVTGEGTLTGIEVRDALVEAEEGDLTPFTTNSTINGCLLAGACVQTPEPPFPPGFTPTPGIQDEVVLIGDNETPPPPFGNEEVIDDNDEDTEDDSPIVPPQPLFDTSEMGDAEGTGNPAFNTPMRSTPGMSREGDVDDPVSGGGNPALMETEPTGNEEGQP